MRSRLALALIPLVAFSAVTVAAPAIAAEPGSQVSVSSLLSEVATASDSTATYDRSLFQHWIDADGDGCDTRQEVLILESTVPVQLGSGCSVTSGKWESWYDGATWTVPSDVDIDHFVPLGEAWRSGADTWSAEQRKAFANDLGLDVGLEAVTDNVNQSKGDRDPANWMPPLAGVECRYVTDWVVVKYRWDLTVDATERAALDNTLNGTCGSALVTVPAKGGPATSTTPTTEPTPTPTPTPTQTADPSAPANPGDTKNCGDFAIWTDAQAWYDTYYPYYGDVARLDSNGDGVVCESLPGAP
ncbi:HNH endonuclease family protein [Cryobacterium sp. CG_9.6]|uniref:HNH endonuclease family protein n=1 Tax=Cryobacterium sp. CG_9.6 TaxID=2760710 RepID=UPI00247514D2|nr:HNH endonuclease family protein [Cryobacterium sp. CG_9.6]MDH6235565.1 hypothetical protein [Cryobacterium sp. CG_9.6]